MVLSFEEGCCRNSMDGLFFAYEVVGDDDDVVVWSKLKLRKLSL